MGSGTTAAVAIAHGRNYLGCELNPAYKELQDDRIRDAFLEASQMELI
jgi:DNA modification methylase